MSNRWDPGQYLRFEAERSRPFADLLARVPATDPINVVDLGCGPGTTTAELVDRWPSAHIVGIDSSPQMVEQARALEIPGRLEFRQHDLREWAADVPVDVLLSCATLQWVPGHLDLFPKFIEALAPGGVFAFQVPGNFDQPSHTILHDMVTSERWKDLLGQTAASGPRSREPAEYLEALLRAGADADVWETTYFHALRGEDPVLQWISGTGLRPVLSALEDFPAEKDEFLASYAHRLRSAYPPDAGRAHLFPIPPNFRRGQGPRSIWLASKLKAVNPTVRRDRLVQDEEHLIAEHIISIQDDQVLTVRISQHLAEDFWRVEVSSPTSARGHISTTVAPGDSFMMNLIDEAVGGGEVAWRHLAEWGHANLTHPASGHRAVSA